MEFQPPNRQEYLCLDYSTLGLAIYYLENYIMVRRPSLKWKFNGASASNQNTIVAAAL